MVIKIVNLSQIDPNFYETSAFSDPKWNNVNFKDRQILESADTEPY
jgi:hypothetical protein